MNQKLVDAYLSLLKVKQESPSYDYLCRLQKKHIETIPHENIDGIFNLPTSFSIPHLLNKYIKEKRGGLCFELNYSFAWLLFQLGFKLEIILAQVNAFDHFKESSPYPTHPIIIVHFENLKVLADVGWSDSYRNPINLNGADYSDHTGTYRIIEQEKKLVMQKYLESEDFPNSKDWFDQFTFSSSSEAIKSFCYPKDFLAAHAYTHVGKGYLFTNLFHFNKIDANGHKAIWGNRLLKKEGNNSSADELLDNYASVLQEQFKLPVKIASQCQKIARSTSAPCFYREKNPEELLKNVNEHKEQLKFT